MSKSKLREQVRVAAANFLGRRSCVRLNSGWQRCVHGGAAATDGLDQSGPACSVYHEARNVFPAAQDLANLKIEELTPLTPEVISRQATINIGKRPEHPTPSPPPGHSQPAPAQLARPLGCTQRGWLFTSVSCCGRHHRTCGARQVDGCEGDQRGADGPLQKRAGAEHHHQAGLRQCKDLQVQGRAVSTVSRMHAKPDTLLLLAADGFEQHLVCCNNAGTPLVQLSV